MENQRKKRGTARMRDQQKRPITFWLLPDELAIIDRHCERRKVPRATLARLLLLTLLADGRESGFIAARLRPLELNTWINLHLFPV